MRNHPRSAGVFAAVMTPVLVATWLLGGFNASTETGPAATKPGAKVALAPIDVTVHTATFTNKSGAISYPGHPNYLLITATVTIRTDKPFNSFDLKNAITVPALKAPESTEDTDAGELLVEMAKPGGKVPVLTDYRSNNQWLGEDEVVNGFNPGLTVDVTLGWDLDLEVKPMKKVEIEIVDFEFAPLTTLKNEDRWLPTSAVAKVELPVKVKMVPEDDA